MSAADLLRGKSQVDMADLYFMLSPEARQLLEELASSKQQKEHLAPAAKQGAAAPESRETVGQEFLKLKSNPAYGVMKALATLTRGQENNFPKLVALGDLNRLEQMANASNVSDLSEVKQLLDATKQKVAELKSKFNPYRFLSIFDQQYYDNSRLVEVAMKFAGVERQEPSVGEYIAGYELEKYEVAQISGGGDRYTVSRVESPGYTWDGQCLRKPKIRIVCRD